MHLTPINEGSGQQRKIADVISTNEHVDVLTQDAALIPDPPLHSGQLRSQHIQQITDRAPGGDLDGHRTTRTRRLAQRPRQPDGDVHTTTARTHRTSGRCRTTSVHDSPSSRLA